MPKPSVAQNRVSWVYDTQLLTQSSYPYIFIWVFMYTYIMNEVILYITAKHGGPAAAIMGIN